VPTRLTAAELAREVEGHAREELRSRA